MQTHPTKVFQVHYRLLNGGYMHRMYITAALPATARRIAAERVAGVGHVMGVKGFAEPTGRGTYKDTPEGGRWLA